MRILYKFNSCSCGRVRSKAEMDSADSTNYWRNWISGILLFIHSALPGIDTHSMLRL
jgi:hypothetical protein